MFNSSVDNSESIKKEMDSALNSEIEDLEAIIGYQVSKSKLYASPPDKEELIKLGKEWFNNNEKKIRDCICSNSKIEAFVKENDNYIDLGIMVADAIVALKISFPAIVISAWIIKKGIGNYCNDTWN